MALNLLACGESSKHDEARDAGGTGSGGEGGSSMTGGAGGSATTGGTVGGGSELDSYFEPGSRLKPIVLTADDGVDIIDGSLDQGWYDTELEFDCFFIPDEAGIERCFPPPLLAGGLHSDASCTRPVFFTNSEPCERLRYQYVTGVPNPPCGYRGFRVGAELPPSTPLFTWLGGACQPASVSSDLGPLYDLEEVPAETFVGMRRTERARAPGLPAYVREGDDDSWQVIGYFDAAREASCFEFPGDLGEPYCLPRYPSASGFFADPTCERRAVDAQFRACYAEPPTAIIDVQAGTATDTCPPPYQLQAYEIDEIRETAPYNVDASGVCVESAGPPVESWVQGAAIELSALPVLETLVVGTGQVRALFSGFGGIPYLPLLREPSPLLGESDSTCRPLEFLDGTLRCVPTAVPVPLAASFLYEDAACSESPVVVWYPSPSCLTEGPLPDSVVIPELSDECPAGLRITEVIAVVGGSTADTFYGKNLTTGACEPASPVAPLALPLLLGEALSPSVFPEIERTIRQ